MVSERLMNSFHHITLHYYSGLPKMISSALLKNNHLSTTQTTNRAVQAQKMARITDKLICALFSNMQCVDLVMIQKHHEQSLVTCKQTQHRTYVVGYEIYHIVTIDKRL